MKCPKCSAEWHLPSNVPTQLKTCPFCGARLQIEPVDGLVTIDAVLVEIVQRFGIDILRNGSKTVAIFSDLAPQLRKERVLLTYLTQFDGNLKLLEVKHLTQAKQHAAYLKVVQHLTDEQFVAQSAAENVCQCFLKAIGVTVAPEHVPSSSYISAPISTQKQIPSTSTKRQLPKNTTPPTIKTVSQKPPAKVKSFDQYMRLLEDFFIQNGKTKLSYQQIKSFISSHNLDVDWKITYADVEKDLEKLYVKHTPPKPIVAAQPTRKMDTSISNYEDYMRALEQRYLDNGKRMLNRAQISDFLSMHQLDRRFKIQISEVEKDLATIYAKYAPVKDIPKPAVSPRTQTKGISTYKEYMDALERMYLDNGKRMLSTRQIADFLSSNSLDKKFGIQVSEVEIDLKTIAEKHKQYQDLTNVLHQKEAQGKASLSDLLRRYASRK